MIMITIFTSNSNLSIVRVRAACHKAPCSCFGAARARAPPGRPRPGEAPFKLASGCPTPSACMALGPPARWSRGPGGPQLENRQLGVPWCLISKQAPSPGRGPPRGLRHLCPSGTKNADSPLTGKRVFGRWNRCSGPSRPSRQKVASVLPRPFMRKRPSQVSPITPVWRRKLAAFQFPFPLEARALPRTAS
jgi:hypothetical protein